ncbi:MAG: SCO family protein [Bacteroidetes bacterium]|nr:SCO family protein [Bacteroidota bacterium]
MQTSSSYLKYPVLILLLVIPFIAYLFLRTGINRYNRLPHYGPHEVKKSIADGKEITDTIYHSIPPFSLTDHTGNTFTEKKLEGKITVAAFFFASCPTICPTLSRNLASIQEKFKNIPGFIIVSHTVDPKRDTVETLAAYAKKYNAIDGKWFFLTGKKEDIYSLAINGYFISASEDALSPGGFIHSELFVLLDKEKHIRGFYNGLDPNEVNKLTDEIKVLYAEYGMRETEAKTPEYRLKNEN